MSDSVDHRARAATAGSVPSERVERPVTEVRELDRPECLALLARTYFGRLVVSVSGWDHPVIRPVNYVFDGPSQSILIRSAPGSKLHALVRSAKAAFEIDGVGADGHLGWSVIVLGVSDEVTDPAELSRIEVLGLDPWTPEHTGHWLRIRVNTVSGRRITREADNRFRVERTPTRLY